MTDSTPTRYPDRTPRRPGVAERRLLLMLGDTVAIGLAVLLSLCVWLVVDGRGLGVGFIARRVYWYPVLAALWLMIASANDFYTLRAAARLDESLMRLVQITVQLWSLYLVIFFFSPRTALPRLFILYYGALSFALIGLWRTARPLVFAWNGGRLRALVVGGGRAAAAIVDVLRREAPDEYTLVGLVTDAGPADNAAPDLPIVGRSADLPDLVRREAVDEIILAADRDASGPMSRALLDCYERGVRIVPMALLYEQLTGRVPVEHLDPQSWIEVLPVAGDALFDPYPPVKRGLDVALALAGLLVLAVLLPGIGAALWLNSPGPLFYRQTRVGQGGRLFKVIKLRTMIPDAERDTGPRWAAPDDPRITRVGRFLRRTRLDEAPQLLNVLRGEMSLIGPRPERPEFAAGLGERIPFYRARNVVQPGITGWAQVRYPYGSSEDDARIKLEYDLYYIRHRSLALDALILLRTVGRMVALRGR